MQPLLCISAILSRLQNPVHRRASWAKQSGAAIFSAEYTYIIQKHLLPLVPNFEKHSWMAEQHTIQNPRGWRWRIRTEVRGSATVHIYRLTCCNSSTLFFYLCIFVCCAVTVPIEEIRFYTLLWRGGCKTFSASATWCCWLWIWSLLNSTQLLRQKLTARLTMYL